MNMSELAIDKNAAGQNMQLYQTELTREIAGAKRQVEALNQRYRVAYQQWQDNQARFTLEHMSNSIAQGPMPLLNLRELQLKRQLTLIDIEHEIMNRYLKILDWTGLISAEPPVNYLSDALGTY